MAVCAVAGSPRKGLRDATPGGSLDMIRFRTLLKRPAQMTRTRPTTLDAMNEASSKMATREGVERGLRYQPDPTDIFISPYAKCGTTWMQQIVHALRTGGDMDFVEITAAVPWLELAHDMGLDLHAPQKARPHAFKSHLAWDDIPKGGRYIVVLRDPEDAFLSYYRFFEGWFFEPGSIPIEEFAGNYLHRPDRGNDTYWRHAASWWGQRDNPDVLLLAYEHMKADLPGTVDRVADFMGGYDAERRALAVACSEFDFMKAHADKFDDNILHAARDVAAGLPADGSSSKVHKGRSGRGKHKITPQIRAAFDAQWRQTMAQPFGLGSYQDVLDALRA